MTELDMKLLNLAFRALEPKPRDANGQPYRGAQAESGQGSGDEWQRLAKIGEAGQGDMFGGAR